MEKNPNIDFGAPGPATHFVESYYKRGYEKLLLESINRFPTNQTLWMLNRIINDVNLENRELYLEAMENVSHRNDVDDSVRNEAQHFYKYQKENKLTDKPVTAVATHIHWDHIGGHKYFSDFYVHGEELSWLTGELPLSMETIRNMVIDRCDLPKNYDVSTYILFQGMPTKVLKDKDEIDIGGRIIEVMHTPGHSPGHMCFWEKERGYLFTGDLVYKDTLFAYYPSTDPAAYLASLEKVALLPVKRVFPGHHSLDIQPEILGRMRNEFRRLKEEGKLHHGSGTFDYGDWGVWL